MMAAQQAGKQAGKKVAQQQAQKMAQQQAKKMAQQQAKKMAQQQAKKQAQKQIQKKIQDQVKEKVQDKVEEKVREKIQEEVEKRAMKQIDQFMAEEETDASQLEKKPEKKKRQKTKRQYKIVGPSMGPIDSGKAVLKELEVDLDKVQEILEEKRLEEENPKLKKQHKKARKKKDRLEKRRKKKDRRQGRGVGIDLKKELDLEDLEEQMAEDWFQKEKQKALESSEDEDDETDDTDEVDETGGTKKKKKKNATPLRSALFSLIRSVNKFNHFLGTFLPCFKSGTYANRITRSVMGFLVGVVLVIFFYILFVFGLKQHPSNAAFTVTIIGPIICFGMAFSRQFSCLMLLMIPQLFSGKGRTILMAYAFLLVLSGPLENLTHNIDLAGKSQVCGSELAMNQSNEVFQLATAPMAPFLDGFKSMIDKLKSILNRVQVGFSLMAKATKATGNAIQTVYDWIASMVSRCNILMEQPAKKCRKHLEAVAARCRHRLGILQFLCGIVNLVANVCDFANVLKLLCIFPNRVVIAVRKIGDAVGDAFDNVKDSLYVNFYVFHDLTLDHEFSITIKQIRDNIRGEVESRLKTFLLVLNWLNRLLSFTFLLLLFRAYLYHRKYLTKDKYDNWYITKHFEDVDELRKEMGKRALLPLNLKERWIFIKPDSVRLAKPEKRRFILSITLWIAEAGYATIVILADYATYWFLDMVRLHSEINVFANAPGAVTVHVEGSGILADVYRSLIESLDPKHIHDFKFDTTKCLPHPTPPDRELTYMIGAIFAICLLMVIFEAYGLRLRRFIMSKHYPERERVRAVWLYNHILRRRGGFRKFLLKNKKKDGQSDAGDVNFFSQIASRSKIGAMLLKIIGCNWKFCSHCGVPGKSADMVSFMHCDNLKCPGVYCLQCVSAVNNLCHLCGRPVDYTLCEGDFEFEKDSSEDETQPSDDDEEKRLQDVSEVLDYSYQYKPPLDQDDDDDEDEEDEEDSDQEEDEDDWLEKPNAFLKKATPQQPTLLNFSELQSKLQSQRKF